MPIGRTNAGGGAPMNFKVLAYATEAALLAATPKENTIGIITKTTVANWIFSASEPAAPVAGMVWIATGTSSPAEFNALKKNALQVYPLSAKQYVSGAWVAVTAMSYQGGEWVSWITYLYNAGDECTAVTGGWVTREGSSYYGTGTVTKNANSIKVAASNVQLAYASTANLIDLTDARTVFVDVSAYSIGGSGSIRLHIVQSGFEWTTAATAATLVLTTTGVFALDVSGLSGKYYVAISAFADTSSDSASAIIDEVYLA